LGIAILSRHTLASDASLEQLTILDVKEFPINRNWYFAYPSGKQLSIVAQAFLEYLKQAPEFLRNLSVQQVTVGHSIIK
jgi:DNA-binding transcriptional LysR family regulator